MYIHKKKFHLYKQMFLYMLKQRCQFKTKYTTVLKLKIRTVCYAKLKFNMALDLDPFEHIFSDSTEKLIHFVIWF